MKIFSYNFQSTFNQKFIFSLFELEFYKFRTEFKSDKTDRASRCYYCYDIVVLY